MGAAPSCRAAVPRFYRVIQGRGIVVLSCFRLCEAGLHESLYSSNGTVTDTLRGGVYVTDGFVLRTAVDRSTVPRRPQGRAIKLTGTDGVL